jgi:ribosomal protein S18 acetylase RimI-like enzyme
MLEFLKLEHTHPQQSREIQDIFFAAYTIEAGLIGISEFPPLQRSARQICEASSTFYGCLQTGQLVAAAEIEMTGTKMANIAGFAVHPHFFRRGIGSRLLHHVLHTLKDARVTVSTASRNMPAIALYEKHGFTISRYWTTHCGIQMVTLSRNSEKCTVGQQEV